MTVKEQNALTLDVAEVIAAPAGRIFTAFFDAAALDAWFGTSRSITSPRMLGPYVLEWRASTERDEVLGRLGGIFRGTVMSIEAAHHIFLADAFWLPPDGGPLGPLAMEVTFTPADGHDGDSSTNVRVVISGFDDGIRWKRYRAHATADWQRALSALKNLLER